MKSTKKIPADLHFPDRQRLTGRTFITETLAHASHTDVFKYAADKVRREVHHELAGKPYDHAFYYIAYEVVIDQPNDDGDGGSSGTLRASPHQPPTNLVQPRLLKVAAA